MRQHRLGHDVAGPTETTSSGAPLRRRGLCDIGVGHSTAIRGARQHRLGHLHRARTTSSGARAREGDNIVWGTNVLDETDTSCGALAAYPAAVPHPRHGPRLMKTLPLAARIFVCAIIAAGAALLVAFFPVNSSAPPWLFLGPADCCRRSPRSSR